ncbi:MAG TPA: hypothetical protein VIL28_05690 [Steroidobacteraceae bacterium]
MIAAVLRIAFGVIIGVAACVALLFATCTDLLESRSRRQLFTDTGAGGSVAAQERPIPRLEEART